MPTTPKALFTVQVRELVEFVWRRGDLAGERDFVGPRRALAGTRGHQQVQRGRPAGYRKEVPLAHEVDGGELVLRVQGRIDGLLVTPSEVCLEEIKTIQGPGEAAPHPLHWAQAKCYGFMHAHETRLEGLVLQLTYLDLATGQVTEFRERHAYASLSAFFVETTDLYLAWLREQCRWRQERDRSIRGLPFPFPRYRPGQRKLAVAAYRTLAQGGRLYLEAPTGIGKTVSVLFPAVKALAEGKLERIFYLTARTVGRGVAEQALADLRGAGLRLRAVTLTAREKLCVRDGQPCDARTCPLALGYFDRQKAAMREALAREAITRPALEGIGQAHQVCPFELGLDVSGWADAVVCDYNHLFDPRVYLRRHFSEDGADYGFLVDEAHNLVDRAREMFSADLTSGELESAAKACRAMVPRCARALTRLGSALRKLGRPGGLEAEAGGGETAPEAGLELFPAGPRRERVAPPAAEPGASSAAGAEGRGLPGQLLTALEAALGATEAWLARNEPADFREALLKVYYRLMAFSCTAERYDEHYTTLVEPGGSARVRLFCLDPATLVRQALGRGKAAVFFSATLTPIDYYRSLLGGSPEDPLLRLPSPFPVENLGVMVHERIRTDFKTRGHTIEDVVRAVGALVEERRGNYLVYFPSYQYLDAVLERFSALYPAVEVIPQRPGMSEAQREAFVAGFASEHGRTLVGFAVMGGIFGEGIDLVGDRLIGAVIVGVGLPQLCTERDVIRAHFEARTGLGFEYAYTFPGMNRVLQAVGRVIRSESDRGVTLLIDTRFAEGRYRRLFPPWWRPVRVTSAEEVGRGAAAFWKPGRGAA